ncbi:MAG: 2-oxo-4-hydroxy-4-carboxy-5-ureidoimidazoline decarboxylase [Rhodospirillales bacterium]
MPALADFNALDRAGFVAALGAVFEHSPWVADLAYAARPFADVAALHRAMVAAVEESGAGRQLALIRAHPDLAGKAARAGALGAHSTREQAGAGLDRLSEEEYARFHRLNDAYQARFGFPFIIAVRDHDKASILAAFETRLRHDADSERVEALRNIARIAELRLADLVR